MVYREYFSNDGFKPFYYSNRVIMIHVLHITDPISNRCFVGIEYINTIPLLTDICNKKINGLTITVGNDRHSDLSRVDCYNIKYRWVNISGNQFKLDLNYGIH